MMIGLVKVNPRVVKKHDWLVHMKNGNYIYFIGFPSPPFRRRWMEMWLSDMNCTHLTSFTPM